MPTTSMPLRRNETAAVEITALAAGAGPPANRMATRRILLFAAGGRDRVVIAQVLGTRSLRCRSGAVVRAIFLRFPAELQNYPESRGAATSLRPDLHGFNHFF